MLPPSAGTPVVHWPVGVWVQLLKGGILCTHIIWREVSMAETKEGGGRGILSVDTTALRRPWQKQGGGDYVYVIWTETLMAHYITLNVQKNVWATNMHSDTLSYLCAGGTVTFAPPRDFRETISC